MPSPTLPCLTFREASFLPVPMLVISAQSAVVLAGERKFETSKFNISKKVREVTVAGEVAWSMLTLMKSPKPHCTTKYNCLPKRTILSNASIVAELIELCSSNPVMSSTMSVHTGIFHLLSPFQNQTRVPQIHRDPSPTAEKRTP
jgi:hypothetical protein